MKNVVGYIRVSTSKQEDQGVSLELQEERIKQYAALYDLNLVAIEQDVASAKSLDREGLNRVVALLESGKAEGVIILKLDRLTRSVKDLSVLLERYFQRFSLYSVQEQIDTSTPAGRLVLNILTSVSQWEREEIGSRTANAMRHMRSNLQYTGGRVPYGFRVEGSSLVPDPREQEAKKLAQDRQGRGYSLRRIGLTLETKGFLPRTGKAWSAGLVKALLAA